MSENTSIDMEVLAPSAVESLERAAIDVQVATAHAYPRSLKKFQSRALDMATIDEETAESCIYVRPVGGGKFAEGASIRLAEIVAASYGNLRVAARIIEQTPRFVRAEGVAHDLETNYAGKSEVIEATLKKDGQPYDERMRIVIAKACLAKAYRDAVFKVVPKALCKTIVNKAKEVSAGSAKPIEERRKSAQAWVASLKIDEKRVLTALGCAGWPDVGNEQLTTLTGLRTSINDKDVTIEEAFPLIDAGAVKAGVTIVKGPDNANLKLAELRNFMTGSNVTEAEVLNALRDLGLADDSLATLDEVQVVQPGAIAKAVKSFDKIVDAIAKANQ